MLNGESGAEHTHIGIFRIDREWASLIVADHELSYALNRRVSLIVGHGESEFRAFAKNYSRAVGQTDSVSVRS